MKKRTVISTIVALSALLIVSGVAEAQPGRGGPGGHRGRGGGGIGGLGPRIAQQLDLNDEQRAAIQAIRSEAREALAPVREDLQQLRTELQELWAAPQPSADAILAKHAQMDELHGIVRDQRIETKQAVNGVLTAEQQAQLAQLRQGRGQGHHGRRGRGGRGGGPGMGGPGGDGSGPGMGGRGGRGGGPGMGGRGGRGGRGGPGMGFGPRMAAELGLTADQQSAIQELRTEARAATASARSELQTARQAARSAMHSGSPDMAAVEAHHAQAQAARQVIRENMVHTRIAILGLLTAEQRAELQANAGQRRGHRGMGRGHRGMGRGMNHGGQGGRGPSSAN